MLDYQYKYCPGGDVRVCDTCSSTAPLRTFQVHAAGRGLETEDQEMCEVCASTPIANAVHYTGQFDNVPLFQALAQCTNMILDAVTGRKPPT